jgi:hypothetical protein
MPKSTNSSRNANSAPTSRSTSPLPPTKTKISPLSSTRPRPEQGQTYVSVLQDAGIQNAFLSKSTASDFMSGYRSNTGLITRVYEIGLAIDELAVARENYLQRRKEMAASLTELDRCLPNGPYFRAIAKKVDAIDPLGDLNIEKIDQPIPDRHQQNTERPSRDKHHSSPPTPARLQQPEKLVATHQPTPRRSAPLSDRRTLIINRRSVEETGHRYRVCRLCGRMGHLQTQCNLYHCAHCNTQAPGHFAKFCPKNPHPGVDRRLLPPGALAHLMDVEKNTPTTTLTPHRSAPTPPTYTKSGVPPNVTGVSTTIYTRAKLSVDNVNTHAADTTTLPTTTIATGPTYRPVLAPRKPVTKPTKDIGKLRQLTHSSTSHLVGRKTSSHDCATKHLKKPQPRPPTPDDGDNEFDFDDVALYNMTGEGHIEGMEAY